jgi:DNA-binding XRE family transcriptional regulator
MKLMPCVMMCDVQEQTFAQRVKQRREQLELSQPQAAEQARLGLDTWRTVERGYKARRGTDPETSSHRPERITVRKIARVLGWQPEQALQWAGYDDELPPPIAVIDPRKTLVEIITELTEEQVQALIHVARTMTDPNAKLDTTYTTEVIRGAPELPDQ